MTRVLALIPTDLKRTGLDSPSRLGDRIAGHSVLAQTLARIQQIEGLDGIVLVHPRGQNPLDLFDQRDGDNDHEGDATSPQTTARSHAINTFAFDETNVPADAYQPCRVTARRWSPTAWRGGLGAVTCYDELLPAGPLAAAAHAHQADAAVLIGPDWPLVDPALTAGVIARHREHPDAWQLVFTQAPPGLAGICVSRDLLDQLAEKQTGFSQIVGYVPTKAQPDPIGLDVCVQTQATVRSCQHRFVYDTPRAVKMIEYVVGQASRLSSDAVGRASRPSRVAAAGRAEHAVGQTFSLPSLDAAHTDSWQAKSLPHRTESTNTKSESVTATLVEPPTDLAALPIEDTVAAARTFVDNSPPQHITLELTPQREVAGPITPHHHVAFDREPIDFDLAVRIIEQVAAMGDVTLTLGALGDALLHPRFADIVAAARNAGVFSLCVETDLLTDFAGIERLLDLPIDVISVRLNADTAATYERVMGADRFKQVTDNLQQLIQLRGQRSRAGVRPGLPWIVPRLIKTADTLGDLETFFDRWLHFAGHAMIEPATTGRGCDSEGSNGALMPTLSPVLMAPPRRTPCRQLASRMTIQSDGRAALCDQDWLGDGAVGDANITSLAKIWEKVRGVRRRQQNNEWDALPLCAGCTEWHRP